MGMLAALLLAEADIEVKIIDQESRTAAQSYACTLHARTLKLLDRLGLATDVQKLGRRVDGIAFYEGEARRAELKMNELSEDFPFVVILPQTKLEALLEQKLKRDRRIQVHWNHRLAELQTADDGVTATIDELGQSAKGYIVPEMDWEVIRTGQTRAAFVIGADGHNSQVRQCLGIEYERLADPESFAVFEFESDIKLGAEARIVLDENSTNVLWPLTDRTCRWSFQLIQPDGSTEFPSKERTDVTILQPAVDFFTRKDVRKFAQARAPWFDGSIDELDWCTDVRFERRLVNRFGQGRCWLAGDAAHQTGPVGMQSMNIGLMEAEELAVSFSKIIREKASIDLLETYNRKRRQEWQRLLGIKGGLRPGEKVDAWTKARCAKILPCIPASGDDLDCLLNQLNLALE